MKTRGKRLNSVQWQVITITVSVVVFGVLAPAYCQTDETALLIRQTPVNGGTVTPQAGVHRVGLNTSVTLTAIPKPGYEFVCWLGDVGTPAENRTAIYVDTPKIVIAVFTRDEYAFLVPTDFAQISLGFGGGRRSRREFGAGLPSSSRPLPPQPPPPPPPPPQSDWFPVPDVGEDEFPVPVPEPTTLLLVASGALLALRKRRARTIG